MDLATSKLHALPDDPEVEMFFHPMPKLEEEYDIAAAWCQKTGRGSRAALKNFKFPNLKRSTLESRLARKSGPFKDQDCRFLLTIAEEKQLVIWIRANGKSTGAQGAKKQGRSWRKIYPNSSVAPPVYAEESRKKSYQAFIFGN